MVIRGQQSKGDMEGFQVFILFGVYFIKGFRFSCKGRGTQQALDQVVHGGTLPHEGENSPSFKPQRKPLKGN